jgi:hypothetical protein
MEKTNSQEFLCKHLEGVTNAQAGGVGLGYSFPVSISCKMRPVDDATVRQTMLRNNITN